MLSYWHSLQKWWTKDDPRGIVKAAPLPPGIWCDASLLVLDYPLIWWVSLILTDSCKPSTKKTDRCAHAHYSHQCRPEQQHYRSATEPQPQWSVWLINALLKSNPSTVFSGGERGVFQPTPLCNIFRSAWLISLRDMLLKHIAFLPPPWKVYKPRFIICFTVRCSKRKDTCVCLCLKINTNILSAFPWCDMLVLDFVLIQPAFFLLWNSTLYIGFFGSSLSSVNL